MQAVLGSLVWETLEGCSLVMRWFLAQKLLWGTLELRWFLALKWLRGALELQWWAQRCSPGVQEWLVACCCQALWALSLACCPGTCSAWTRCCLLCCMK